MISRAITEFSNLDLHPKCREVKCHKILDNDLCGVYLEPCKQWTRLGGCAGQPMTIKAEEKGKIDPLKASKRGIKQ